MEVYLDAQINQLLWAVGFGFAAGVLYDFVHALWLALGNKRHHALKDGLFWAVTILAVFFFNVAFFSGETSFYFPFARGVGGMIYLHLLSRIVSTVFGLLVFPLKKLRELLKKTARSAKRYIRRRKTAYRLRRQIKKRPIPQQNAVENTNYFDTL